MAAIRVFNLLLLLLFTQTLAAEYISQEEIPTVQSVVVSSPLTLQVGEIGNLVKMSARRMMIGSVAPTCTYNECRGCKHRCRAEQVPVEGNDPINSAYHYRCVCHR